MSVLTSWRLYSPSSKKLHTQQSEHHNEEKEKKKQADNGLHGAHEGHNQVPERGPVSDRKKSQTYLSFWTELCKNIHTNVLQAGPNLAKMCCPTYLVILKILRSLSALSTLIPNDMPGLKKPQTTSKMLPTMTCKTCQTLATKKACPIGTIRPAAHLQNLFSLE